MNSIQQLILEKKREIEAFRRKLTIAEAELRAYERAADLMPSAVSPTSDQRSHRSKRQEAASSSTELRQSGHWAQLFQYLPNNREFTLDEAMDCVELLGLPINRNAMRSNLANYANRGIIRRVRQGVFRLAQASDDQIPQDPAPALPPEPAQTSPKGMDDSDNDSLFK